MTQEQKIKALLDSPNEQNQLLGCQYARTLLNWSFYDIGYYVLNSGKGWDIKPSLYFTESFYWSKSAFGGNIKIIILESIGAMAIKYASYSKNKPFLTKSLFCGSELERTKAEISGFIRKICNDNFIL